MMFEKKSYLGISRRVFALFGLMIVEQPLICTFDDFAVAEEPSTDFPHQVMQLGSGMRKRMGDQWSAVRPGQNGDTESLDSGNPHAVGAKVSFVPDLGTIVWRLPQDVAASVPFSARIYQTENCRRFGYVRIPNFECDEDVLARFGETIGYFENETEALVLDEVNNPGGSMFQMYAFLSYLTDAPLSVPKHELRLVEDEVR